jgi:hypothetical protein
MVLNSVSLLEMFVALIAHPIQILTKVTPVIWRSGDVYVFEAGSDVVHNSGGLFEAS